MVNQKKHSPQMNATNRSRRNINEVTTGGRGKASGRGGHGRGGRGGKHGGRGNRGKTRTDSRMITLTDGSQIEYHASFNFPKHVYLKMKQEDCDTLKRERAANNERNGRSSNCISEIQELVRSQIEEVRGSVSNNSPPTHSVPVSNRSQVSQMTTNNSIMGGRNEQASNRQARRAAAVVTKRQVQSAHKSRSWTDPPVNTTADNKCATNTDTCCLGKNFLVVHSTYRTADVYAYDTSIQPIENVPIVTAATASDDPESGDTFILVFNEALYYREKLDHSLINPNQIWSYGIPFWDNPFDPEHNLSIEVHPDLTIPLRAFGTKVGFCTRVPTQLELRECEHIHMTSSSLWNPSDVVMVQATAQGGQSPWKRRRVCCLSSEARYEYLDPNSDEALLHEIDPSLVLMTERLTKQQRISQVETVYEQIDAPARRTL